MATSTINLKEYEDQKVIVKYKEADGKTKPDLEGKVEAAHDDKGMLLIKPKGKSGAELVLKFEIASIELVTSSDDDLAQVTLKPVKLNNVRRHLVNYHGWGLKQVNQLGDDEALIQHTGLHEGPDAGDIGHKHEA